MAIARIEGETIHRRSREGTAATKDYRCAPMPVQRHNPCITNRFEGRRTMSHELTVIRFAHGAESAG
jgi:hypothetical protein